MRRLRIVLVIVATLGGTAVAIGAPVASACCPDYVGGIKRFVRDTADTTAPTQPTGLTATAASREIRLAWNGSTDSGGSGLSGYRIERSRDGGAFEYRADVWDYQGTSFVDGLVERRTTYTYRVIACDHAGNCSPPSNTASATP